MVNWFSGLTSIPGVPKDVVYKLSGSHWTMRIWRESSTSWGSQLSCLEHPEMNSLEILVEGVEKFIDHPLFGGKVWKRWLFLCIFTALKKENLIFNLMNGYYCFKSFDLQIKNFQLYLDLPSAQPLRGRFRDNIYVGKVRNHHLDRKVYRLWCRSGEYPLL